MLDMLALLDIRMLVVELMGCSAPALAGSSVDISV
jgi:hypothetical protein